MLSQCEVGNFAEFDFVSSEQLAYSTETRLMKRHKIRLIRERDIHPAAGKEVRIPDRNSL